MSISNSSGRRGLVPARSRRLALLLAAAVLIASASCGGGTDGPAESATAPVVGGVERPHCPARTLPVPPGLDFSGKSVEADTIPEGQDLRGANFDGATLIGADFKGDMTGATFRGARIANMAFEGTLYNANFEGAVFVSQFQFNQHTFFYAPMDNACFIGAVFRPDQTFEPPIFFNLGIYTHTEPGLVGVDFSFSDILDDPEFTGIAQILARPGSARNVFRGLKVPCIYFDKAYLKAMDLTGADLSGCESAFDGKDMSNFAFDGLDLRNFHFDGTNLAGATFAGAQLGGNGGPRLARLDNALNLGKANFSRARLSNMVINASNDANRIVSLEGVDFSNAEIDNVYISGSLKNAHFEHSTLTDVVLDRDVELDGAKFTGATLVRVAFNATFFGPGTDFTGARITGAGQAQVGTDFIGQRLDAVTFDSAVLNNVIFEGASLVGTSFRNATIGAGTTFRKGRITSIAANAAGAHFENLNGIGADFTQLSAVGAHFDNASLSNSRWGQAILESASFQSATLDHATGLNGTAAVPARLAGAYFNKASAVGVDFSNAQLYGADFTYADLSNTSFAGSFLTSEGPTHEPIAAKFDGARLRNVTFASANLQSASFVSANIYGSYPAGAPAATCETRTAMCPSAATGYTCGCASMAGADLGSADFSGAFLWGVDFANSATVVSGTKFDGAVLIGANFDGVNLRVASGAVPSFKGAMLQGANLGATVAGLKGATLTGAYLDFEQTSVSSGGNDVSVLLGSDHTQFRNWSGPARVCVVAGYNQPSIVPAHVSLNCPDGSNGVCGAGTPRPSPNPHWNSRSPLAVATPVPGWYALDATYDRATTDPAAVCGGAPVIDTW